MSESKPKTVSITTYALSKGVLEKSFIRNVPGGNVMVSWTGGVADEAWINAGQWHATREAALARAEEMRLAKIASHQRSIEKLRGLSFDPVSPTPAGAISGAQEG